MKRKKGTIGLIAILLVIILLAVGYASIVKNLEITGSATASVDIDNFVIGFTDAVSVIDKAASTSDIDVTPTYDGSATASLIVTGMTAKDDQITATYTITNSSTDLKASLGIPDVTYDEASGYFEVTAELGVSTLAPGESTTCTVVVKCIKTPSDNDVSTDITIDIEATAVEASSL